VTQNDRHSHFDYLKQADLDSGFYIAKISAIINLGMQVVNLLLQFNYTPAADQIIMFYHCEIIAWAVKVNY
jgi:hypothetical protein